MPANGELASSTSRGCFTRPTSRRPCRLLWKPTAVYRGPFGIGHSVRRSYRPLLGRGLRRLQLSGRALISLRSTSPVSTRLRRAANLDPTPLRGPSSRLILRNRAAAHGNETAALSLFEQPFCSGVQSAKVTLLRVRALRRIAKSNGPTAGGQRIDRTGDLVAAKYDEERAGADTSGLLARCVVLGTLQEVTVRHFGRVPTIVTGRRPLVDELPPNAGRVPVSAQDKLRFPRRLASYQRYRRLSA